MGVNPDTTLFERIRDHRGFPTTIDNTNDGSFVDAASGYMHARNGKFWEKMCGGTLFEAEVVAPRLPLPMPLGFP